MKYDLKSIANNFKIEGNYLRGSSYGSGHINDTFCIQTAEDSCPDYILQRINHHVFRNIPKLQENIERVTKHIQKKLSKIPNSNPARECLTLIHTTCGKLYYQDNNGNYWRMYIFIDKNKSYDIVDCPEKAYDGGKAFGKFQALLTDMPGGPLYETIPDFHNIEKRLKTFYNTVKNNPVNRVKEITKEIEFVKKRAEEMVKIIRLGREEKIPVRITHNDTKFNNVLFSKGDKALCIIDLDTVMPGYVHYDFGDSIRTTTNTGAEDEKDLSKVSMDIKLFKEFANGFLEETKTLLTKTEIDNLAFSGKLLTFIMGLRFLTDYIDGNNYYKIHFGSHNLQRARAQFKLLTSMEEQYEEMQMIIKKLVSNKANR